MRDKQIKQLIASSIVLVAALVLYASFRNNDQAELGNAGLDHVSQVTTEIDGSPYTSRPNVAADNESGNTFGKSGQLVLTRRQKLSNQLDDILAGNGSIVAYIHALKDKAIGGDAEAAYFVTRAMNECGADINSIAMTLPLITGENEVRHPVTASDLKEFREPIGAYLVGKPEFYRTQAMRRVDRAIECLELGQSHEILNESQEILQVAITAKHPLALMVTENIFGGEISKEKLVSLRQRARNFLEQAKNREIFFYAGDVAAISLDRDRTSELLAWSIAACEYSSCNSLNRYYRGRCELMSLHGEGDFCADDLTDLEYLMQKYPGHFDVARARAAEIVNAIESEAWEELGL